MMGKPDDLREKRENESYLEYWKEESKRAQRLDVMTVQNQYKYAWNKLKKFSEKNGYEIEQMGDSEVNEFCEFLEEEDISERVAAGIIKKIDKVVGWLVNKNVADHNPYNDYIKYFDIKQGSHETSKMEVPLDVLREKLQEAKSYSIELFVYLVLILKTGLRKSEAMNLDLRDIHLNHPISKKMPEPRTEIYNIPDTLYVDSSITAREEANGEIRQLGNKEKSSRKIPIDQELKDLLTLYVAMLPPSTSEADPLLRQSKDPEARRIERTWIAKRVTRWAREHDLNSPEKKHFGVDSHWCRHWFTTILRSNINDEDIPIGNAKDYVKGLRGDTGNDVIDTYSHEWESVKHEDSKSYREIYEESMPHLLTKVNNEK